MEFVEIYFEANGMLGRQSAKAAYRLATHCGPAKDAQISSMNDFVALRSNWRMVALIGGSLGFVAAGLWMTGVFNDVPVTRRYTFAFTVAAGWLCVAFFSFCALAGVKGLFGPREVLRIGPAGIRWSSWSDQTIPWAAITDVTTWKVRGQTSLVLHLHEQGSFPARTALASPALNRAITGGDIAISLTGTDRTIHEAISAIDQFRLHDS